AALVVPPTAGAAESERSGVLHVAYGDPLPGTNDAARTLYTLWQPGDRYTQLDIPDAVIQRAGGVTALQRQAVTVRGIPQGDALLEVSSITIEQARPDNVPLAQAEPASLVSGPQQWLTILCKFDDITN